jgi:outer membrane protein
MYTIQQALRNALDTVGAEGGYVCIFDLSGGIPYVSKSLCEDVTMKVRAKLGIPANAVPAANLLQGN